MGLDEVVPGGAGTVQGKSAAEGVSAIGEAAGVAAKQSAVLANPQKGRKKTPAEVVVPVGDVPGAVVVGSKSDVPPVPKARTTPAADRVSCVPPDPKARTTPAAEGVALGRVPGVVDPIGAGYNPQVGGSLVLEKVYIREKATSVANLPSFGGTPATTPASMVHVGGDQDDNSSESPQLKEPPEQLQAMDDWWKKIVPPHRAAGPREIRAAVGGTFSGPNRELMKDLRRFQSERFQSEQARLGASPRKSVELMEASEEVEEDSGGRRGNKRVMWR